MRNPKRIDRILKLLKKYWKINPDLRLGQLIYNVSTSEDCFYLEDDSLELSLEKYLEREC